MPPLRPSTPEARFTHLDGLRGFASLQVVFLHLISAFASTLYVPGAGMSAWQSLLTATPLFFFYDGYSAVYLFFLLSGFVLTHAFAREPTALGKNVLRRLVRLGIPVAASVLLGFVCYRLAPGENQRVADLTGSAWLRQAHEASAPTVAFLGRDVLLNSLFLGYAGTSIFSNFPALATWLHLDSASQALNAPLWTLHLEFYGSLLIIFLLWLRAHSRVAHIAALIFFAVVMAPHPLFLFVLGHLACLASHRWATSRNSSRTSGPWTLPLGAGIAIALGISICSRKNLPALTALFNFANPHFVMPAQASPYFQSQVGALLIFLGVLILGRVEGGRDPITRLLNSAPLQWAGKYSFGIYLVHFPIILTAGCASYLALAPHLSRHPLALVVMLGSLMLTTLAAMLLYHLADRPAIAWSRRLGGGAAKTDA